MNEMTLYRILTHDGLLSTDCFVVAPVQPDAIRTGCVLAINQRDLTTLTVHETRLVPAETSLRRTSAADSQAVPRGGTNSACLKCGRVQGVVLDRVTCPEHGDNPCQFLAGPAAPV
jgi:hypothetical protein